MQALPHTLDEVRIELKRCHITSCLFPEVLVSHRPNRLANGNPLIIRKNVGNFTAIENVINVFCECRKLYLRVRE